MQVADHPTKGFDAVPIPNSAVYPLQCGDVCRHVTMCPPLPVEWGAAWWVRIADVWLKLRERPRGEAFDTALERELCALLSVMLGG
jgi:hypothetical protein